MHVEYDNEDSEGGNDINHHIDIHKEGMVSMEYSWNVDVEIH